MASSRPTFLNKVDRQTQPGNRINLVIADDINQLKNGIIALYNMFGNVKMRVCVTIERTDFSGNNYYNTKLVGLTPDVDFRIFTNEGSGTLLRWDDDGYDPEGGYSFNPGNGQLVMTPQAYSLEIYLPVTEL
jgi:hypothetical protein